jgi:hypothetical protein
MDTNRILPAWIQLLTSYPARLAGYGLLTMVVFQFVFSLLQDRGCMWLAAENGPLELSQVGCLLIAVAGIAIALRWTPIGRTVLVATGAVALYAAARESDQWFESVFFDDAYKWLVGLPVAIVVIAVAYFDRGKIVNETLQIAQRPGATLFTIGGIYLCFFCQMLDRPLFWPVDVMDLEGISRKMLIEECSELFAYLLIAFSGFEVMISAHQDRFAASAAKGAEPISLRVTRRIRRAA